MKVLYLVEIGDDGRRVTKDLVGVKTTGMSDDQWEKLKAHKERYYRTDDGPSLEIEEVNIG